MKWKRLLMAMPAMGKLLWSDWYDYISRLYIRGSWKNQGMFMPASTLFNYEHREQIRVQKPCWVGSNSIIVVKSSQDTGTAPLLFIGNNTYLGDQTNIRAAGGVIKIGNQVLIANQVTIVSSNHGIELGRPIIDQPWRRGDVIIEDDVWIGAGVVILPGAIIRKGAVIAAGAVVRGEIPANTIFGGVPARQIGVRS